jgi:thymidylate synthase
MSNRKWLSFKVWEGEHGYIDMIKHILANGVETTDRTGVGCIKTFDNKIIYDIGNGDFPFSTLRPAPLRMAFEEFWMFMRGETNTKILEDKEIFFWQGNTTREFLDKRGLKHLPEGDMGKAYGYQWRQYSGLIDQLTETIETLRKDPFSRRIYTTFWNPVESKDMALTPCWHSHLFNVIPDEDGSLILNLKVFNRSLDSVFGKSFAAQQYGLYMMCIAKMLNMKLGCLVLDLSDTHIYLNQIEYATEMVGRDFGRQGTIEIKKELNSLEDMLSLTWEDIEVSGLVVNKTKFETPRPPMAA